MKRQRLTIPKSSAVLVMTSVLIAVGLGMEIRSNTAKAEFHNHAKDGLSGLRVEQYEKCLNSYRKALDSRPEPVAAELSDAYNNRGWCLWRLKRVDGAIEAFETSLRLAPDKNRARNNLQMARRWKAQQR